jgi:signal transduction histidine kinase
MLRPPFFSQFRTRLLLLVAMVLAPAFALVLYGNFEQRRIETDLVRRAAGAQSQLAAACEENLIKNAHQLLRTLTQFDFLVLGKDAKFCSTHFDNLRKLSPDYANFGLIELDGLLFCSAVPLSNSVSLKDRTYFRRTVESRSFSMGEFQVGRLTGEQSLNFGYPVLDAAGNLKRVVFASLKLRRLSEVLESIRLPAGTTLTVVDRLGTVLARQPEPEKWVGKSLIQAPVVRRILAPGPGVFEMPGLDGHQRLHAVTAINEGHSPALFVSVGIPLEVSFAHANQVLARNLVVLAAVAILVLVAGRIYAERIFLQPVQSLSLAAHRLGEGDLTTRAHEVGGGAELAQLGQAFDIMAERLQKRRKEIEQLNADLEVRVKERTVELEAANRELEAFSYSVSHDLRAPLRHIGGFVNLLRQKATPVLDETSSRYLDQITNSTKQMGQLVDDLLMFSRMARADLRPIPVALEPLVKDIRKNLGPELDNREIEWKIGELRRVNGDPALLRVVFTNLISNAVKYTRPRKPARIEIGCDEQDGKDVVFVRDNGVGFNMNYAGKLFGVFQRLHNEEDFEGTGIGLATVQRIILRHRGRVWAEAREGEGATFYVALPRA